MKSLLVAFLILMSSSVFSQTRIYPLIKNYGGIFDIPYAEEKPDPSLDYNIVVEVERAIDSPDSLNWALNNVARLLNVHVMAGVKPEKLHVVLAIHGGAALSNFVLFGAVLNFACTVDCALFILDRVINTDLVVAE